MQLLKTHNWPFLPRETATSSVKTTAFSTSKSFSIISPSSLTEDSFDFKSKNVLPINSNDALSSLLSFSPLPLTLPKRVNKEIKIYDESSASSDTVHTPATVCTGLDVSFLLNPSPLETENNSAVKITKSAPRRSIPTFKKRTPLSKISKENVVVKNGTGTGDSQQSKNNFNSAVKNGSLNWTVEKEKEYLLSQKKLLIPSENDVEENSFPVRVLDMSEF